MQRCRQKAIEFGWRDREQVSFPIRPHLEKKGIEFVAQRVQRIDAVGNALELADGARVAYDYLVITTGPKLAFDEVPGSGPDAHTLSICTYEHAERAFGAEFMANKREEAREAAAKARERTGAATEMIDVAHIYGLDSGFHSFTLHQIDSTCAAAGYHLG